MDRSLLSQFSVVGGPELQTRIDVVILRGCVACAPHDADGLRLHRESSFTPVVGFFGGIDVYPGIGWSIGTTVSIAVF